MIRPTQFIRTSFLMMVLTLTGVSPILAQGLDLPSVFLEELTWTEVRDAIDSGTTTIIIPTAGTEQNGPHMVLGKHKFIVNYASAMIARELGNTLVAPVVTYVPEGDVNNPTRGHLSKAGTITFPEEFYTKLLEYAARSLAVHGFTDIVMIGDSGGNPPRFTSLETTTPIMASASGWKSRGRPRKQLGATQGSQTLHNFWL